MSIRHASASNNEWVGGHRDQESGGDSDGGYIIAITIPLALFG